MFQAASKDAEQTSSQFSASANTQETELLDTRLEFSQSTWREHETTFSCIFFHLFGFHEIGFILVLKISCRKKSIKFHLTSFEFHGENEFSQDVYKYIIKVGGTIRKSVPNWSPSQEVFVGSFRHSRKPASKRSKQSACQVEAATGDPPTPPAGVLTWRLLFPMLGYLFFLS